MVHELEKLREPEERETQEFAVQIVFGINHKQEDGYEDLKQKPATKRLPRRWYPPSIVKQLQQRQNRDSDSSQRQQGSASSARVDLIFSPMSTQKQELSQLQSSPHTTRAPA